MTLALLFPAPQTSPLGLLGLSRQLDARSVPFSEPDGDLRWDPAGRALAVASTGADGRGGCVLVLWPTMRRTTLRLSGAGGLYVRWSRDGSRLLVGGGGEALVLNRRLEAIRRLTRVADARWAGGTLRTLRGLAPDVDDLPTTVGGRPKPIGTLLPLALASNSSGVLKARVERDGFALQYLPRKGRLPVAITEEDDFPDERPFCLQDGSRTLLGFGRGNAYGLQLWCLERSKAGKVGFERWRKSGLLARAPLGEVFVGSEPTRLGGRLVGAGVRMGESVGASGEGQYVLLDFGSRTILPTPESVVRLAAAQASDRVAVLVAGKGGYQLRVMGRR